MGIVPGNEIDAKIVRGDFAVIALKDYDPRAMLVRNSPRYVQDLARDATLSGPPLKRKIPGSHFLANWRTP